jgi:hypothetical protein
LPQHFDSDSGPLYPDQLNRKLVRAPMNERVMSQLGQSLPNRDVRVASLRPSISDIILRRRE